MAKQIEEQSMASKGGKAAAENMTPEERQERAKKAATARWREGVPFVTHGDEQHPLRIGNCEVPCYVLNDGRRVITQRGLQNAVGMNSSGGAQRLLKMVGYFESKGLDIKGLTSRISEPVKFVTPTGVLAHGYEATALADFCKLIMDAERKGKLLKRQEHYAEQCRAVYDGFAHIGIIGLVDEATGYQYVRQNDELRKILESFISKELARWVSTFKVDFYKQIYRLRRWSLNPESAKRPGIVARYTVDLVYDRIHPDLLEELKKSKVKWETKGGVKGGKLHQFLTTDLGHPRLREHIEGVIMVMRFSTSWDQMMHRMDEAYPKLNMTPMLPFPTDEDMEAD